MEMDKSIVIAVNALLETNWDGKGLPAESRIQKAIQYLPAQGMSPVDVLEHMVTLKGEMTPFDAVTGLPADAENASMKVLDTVRMNATNKAIAKLGWGTPACNAFLNVIFSGVASVPVTVEGNSSGSIKVNWVGQPEAVEGPSWSKVQAVMEELKKAQQIKKSYQGTHLYKAFEKAQVSEELWQLV